MSSLPTTKTIGVETAGRNILTGRLDDQEGRANAEEPPGVDAPLTTR